jgi:hypothetical protein
MLAKAVAHHTTASFIRVVGSEFVQKYLGEVRRAGKAPFLCGCAAQALPFSIAPPLPPLVSKADRAPAPKRRLSLASLLLRAWCHAFVAPGAGAPPPSSRLLPGPGLLPASAPPCPSI